MSELDGWSVSTEATRAGTRYVWTRTTGIRTVVKVLSRDPRSEGRRRRDRRPPDPTPELCAAAEDAVACAAGEIAELVQASRADRRIRLGGAEVVVHAPSPDPAPPGAWEPPLGSWALFLPPNRGASPPADGLGVTADRAGRRCWRWRGRELGSLTELLAEIDADVGLAEAFR